MYCKECGKELSEQAKTCEYCGALTRKGAAFRSIKRKLWIGSGIILLIVICYEVLVFSGTIDNVKGKIAQNKLERELKKNTTDILENYAGNNISVYTDNVSGQIIYEDEDIYIVDANNQSNNYMFYCRDGQVYKSFEFDSFVVVDNELPLYEQYINVLDEISESMELVEYDGVMATFEGEIDKTDKLLVNYNVFLSLFGIKPVEADDITFNLLVSTETQEDVVINFDINSDNYQVVLSNVEEDPKEIIKSKILNKKTPLKEAVCYDSETDTEVVLYTNNLFVDDNYELLVRVFINGEEKQMDYEAVKILDTGVSIGNVTYPYGTREEYEEKMAERKEKMQEAEKVRDALLKQIKNCISVKEKYNLYRAMSYTYEEYGFFTKDTITDRWLEDHGDKIAITEITPVLLEDENENISYIIECKGYYIYDGEKREFTGELFDELNYVELKLKDVNEHMVRNVGFSIYRIVAEPQSDYFGSDMELRKKNGKGETETIITNYAE